MLLLVTALLATACSTLDVSAAGVTELSASTPNTYDALNPKGRRKAPSSITMGEDRHLPDIHRRRLIGGHRELRRNCSVLAWMLRRHLDYVATHTFQSTTGDEGWDDEVELWMREESEPEKFETRGMLCASDFVRLTEAMAVIDGDLGVMFVDEDSGLLQGIEGDRIKDPWGQLAGGTWSMPSRDLRDEWYNGVHVDRRGRPVGYAVHRRVGGRSALEFEREVPARHMHLHGYLDRFDQYRGISPVASAYNDLRDVYEGISLHLVQAKVAGLFGLKVTRSAEDYMAMGKISGGLADDGTEDRSSYTVDFGAGPVSLDMDPGDNAEFLSSDNPGVNMQDFWRFTTMVALLSVDLPYSFLDSTQGNFFGNKAAMLVYDRACETKRDRVRRLRDAITLFKYRIAVRDGRLRPPRSKRGDVISLATKPWSWTARKMPWWRPLEEVTANLKAIEGGLTTPQRVCAESDTGDFFQNVDDIAEARAYAEKKGVPLSFAVPDQMANMTIATRDKDKGGDE
jgi:hypothetical protein